MSNFENVGDITDRDDYGRHDYGGHDYGTEDYVEWFKCKEMNHLKFSSFEYKF